MSNAALANRKQREILRIFKCYLWLLPAILLSALFRYYPFLNGIVLSFQEWDGVSEPVFVGLNNFKELLTNDPEFWDALFNNLIFAIFTVTGKVSLALLLALVVNQKLPGMTFYRTAFFTPVVMSFVVVGLLWGWIYDYNFGLLNGLLRLLGLESWVQDWLGDPNLAMGSCIWVDIWKWFGYHMIIYVAALQGIPRDLLEAASIDGANKWQSFKSITWPLLRPITAVNVTVSLMGGFSVFDLIYVLTSGGPYKSTNVVNIHMYHTGFKFYRMGYANAMTYLMFIIIAIATVIQLKLMNKNETR